MDKNIVEQLNQNCQNSVDSALAWLFSSLISDVACNLVNCAMPVYAVTPRRIVPRKWEMLGAMLVNGTADNK